MLYIKIDSSTSRLIGLTYEQEIWIITWAITEEEFWKFHSQGNKRGYTLFTRKRIFQKLLISWLCSVFTFHVYVSEMIVFSTTETHNVCKCRFITIDNLCFMFMFRVCVSCSCFILILHVYVSCSCSCSMLTFHVYDSYMIVQSTTETHNVCKCRFITVDDLGFMFVFRVFVSCSCFILILHVYVPCLHFMFMSQRW